MELETDGSRQRQPSRVNCGTNEAVTFSEGASFYGPDGRLEGKGKNRRHLKFVTVEDVEGKGAEGFLKQALR